MTDDDREERADWLAHPCTRRTLRAYEERRSAHIKSMCMVAAYSTDTKMVALAGQLKELELAVVEHGGARLIYGGKNGEIKE